jgi:hypothetical protein
MPNLTAINNSEKKNSLLIRYKKFVSLEWGWSPTNNLPSEMAGGTKSVWLAEWTTHIAIKSGLDIIVEDPVEEGAEQKQVWHTSRQIPLLPFNVFANLLCFNYCHLHNFCSNFLTFLFIITALVSCSGI